MKLIPLYSTTGDWAGLFHEGHIFNNVGEWIGFVAPGTNQVYSVRGEYVGWLSNDFRVLRKRAIDELAPRLSPPPRPPKLTVPASVPLPPLMSDLTYDTIDVFDEMPDRLHTSDEVEETRPDMD